MGTLDQWEAEAKRKELKFHECTDENIGKFVTLDEIKDQRILSLIDLIRKKDEVLKRITSWIESEEKTNGEYLVHLRKFSRDGAFNDSTFAAMFLSAKLVLALTDELK